jgi:hypothetical protein
VKPPQALSSVKRRYGSDVDVEALTGISRKTLRKDRLLGRQRFPWYRVGRRVLYDLDEVEQIIRAGRGAAVPTLIAEAHNKGPAAATVVADAPTAEVSHA